MEEEEKVEEAEVGVMGVDDDSSSDEDDDDDGDAGRNAQTVLVCNS